MVIGIATARPGGINDPLSATLTGLATLMLVSVGSVLVTRLPRHLVGWLLVVGGLLLAASLGSSGIADRGLNVDPGSVPAAIWSAWLGEWIWAPEIACLFILLPLFYPTGRLPSPRWRAVVFIGGAVVVVGGVGGALSPWVPNPYPVGNPLELAGSTGEMISGLGNAVASLLVVTGGALAVASLVVRYRGAAAVERQQLKWFAAVATVIGLAGTINIAAYAASGAATPTGTLGVVVAISGLFVYGGLALLPLAIGIAVLRYRLYEIDRLISRTIGYGVLTAIVASLFVAFVLALQAVLAPLTQSNQAAVAGSTLIVFSLFQPLRRRTQRLVDRRFNRTRYDAERTVAALAGRLRDEVDLTQLTIAINSTVASTVEPAFSSLWLRS